MVAEYFLSCFPASLVSVACSAVFAIRGEAIRFNRFQFPLPVLINTSSATV